MCFRAFRNYDDEFNKTPFHPTLMWAGITPELLATYRYAYPATLLASSRLMQRSYYLRVMGVFGKLKAYGKSLKAYKAKATVLFILQLYTSAGRLSC